MAWNALWTILGVMLVFLALGVPISYSIGISSLAAILATVSADAAVVTAAQRIFVGMSRFSLTAIPFFILAGNLMNQGGIAGRLGGPCAGSPWKTSRFSSGGKCGGQRPVRGYFRVCVGCRCRRGKHGAGRRRGAGL